jgi:conjugative relaxase-like TrwC/TraI family protein
MLSVKPLGKAGGDAAKGAAGYYENLAKEDYYEQGGEPPGRWLGQLAGEMELAGQVKDGQLRAMFEGYHPETGEQLAKNAGSEHKAGWDQAFSAPKSVSTVWAVAGQDTRAAIQAAQDKAVKASLAFLEQHAFSTRDRQGNAQVDKLLAAIDEKA